MNQPKLNEVWMTKSGRLCLIIAGPQQIHTIMPASGQPEKLMLWHDDIEGWTASEILERLQTKTALSPWEFFASVPASEQQIAIDNCQRENKVG
jgi:hypothetical protein